jgi:hypothetical protein
MKKIQIDPAEQATLDSLLGSGAPGLALMRRIFDHYVDDLGDVRNIDPKGNVGLQTVARQEALNILEEIRGTIFTDSSTGRGRANVQMPATVTGKPLRDFQ